MSFHGEQIGSVCLFKTELNKFRVRTFLVIERLKN